MVRRLCSLVVALAMAGAPVALAACQIACASMASHAGAGHHMHPTSRHATAADGACDETASALRHLGSHAPSCDHHAEATAATVAAARTSNDALPIAAAGPPVPDVVLVRASTLEQPRRSTLPDRLEIRIARPLRI